ncbi:NAD-binding protein [Schizopora paradoxa]|uniref:NAD-binding protein n=1 Tax=Schizopora paradoxa TaxID=27342 RepID=A0A0H2RTT9_9AGAM|nr:NAD-binding protein [Schizopora paradoxa]
MAGYLESLFSLEGKTALVTGGTRGIGRALATALAKAGADIVLAQRDVTKNETANAIASETSRKVHIVECDLSEQDQVRKLVHRVTASKDEGGLGLSLDILVNCGGIQRRHRCEEFPEEDWNEVLQVNLNAVWTLSRDMGKYLLERYAGVAEKPSHIGKIVNVASLLSFQGGYTVPAYATAKHGVVGMTKALSNEWSSQGINVNCIAPGYVSTDMNTALLKDVSRSRQILERIPAGRWGQPSDFEGAIVFLTSNASDYTCGETLTIDGGWMAR